MKFENNVSRISRLKDVDLTNLSDLKVLQYNATTGKWEAVTMNEATGTVSILDDLTDVQVATAVSGQILQFDGTNWIPADNSGGTGGISEELETIGFNVNANKAVTIGYKGYRALPYDIEIQGWKIIVDSDTSNSITIDLDKTNDLITFTSIISVNTSKPSLTNGKYIVDNTLDTNWNVNLNKNDIIRFHIEEVTNIKNLWFFMDIKRVVS